MTTQPLPSQHFGRMGRLLLIALVSSLLFAGFTALGVWQVKRRAWKHDLMARVSQRLRAPAAAIPEPSEWQSIASADYTYRHVKLEGQWLLGKTALTQATTTLGQGFWVLTPLQRADGTIVLINRGFIPQSQRKQWLPGARPASPPGPVIVEGLLRATEPDGGFLRRNDPAAQRWYSRDVAAIAKSLQLSAVAPFFVDAGLPATTADINPESSPVANSDWPREGLTIVHFSDNHLVYAITWFGLAAMVLVGAGFVARYERKIAREDLS